MPRPIIAWSFSGLTNFEGCARRFWATKVAKLVNDANQYNLQGDDEHKSIEGRLKRGAPLHGNIAGLEPLMQKITAAPGQQYVEFSMALRQDLTPTKWNDWDNVWVRGAGDFVKINGNRAFYFDWKSGKPRDLNEDQIDLTSLLIFRHFPEVQSVTGSLVYYRHSQITPPVTVGRSAEGVLWNGFIARVKEMEKAKLEDNWPTNPHPLCGWCAYLQCPFNRVAERTATEARGEKWKWKP